MKRLTIDVFLAEEDYNSLTSEIQAIKSKCKDLKDESSRLQVHDCNNEAGKPCSNLVIL